MPNKDKNPEDNKPQDNKPENNQSENDKKIQSLINQLGEFLPAGYLVIFYSDYDGNPQVFQDFQDARNAFAATSFIQKWANCLDQLQGSQVLTSLIGDDEEVGE